MQNAKEGIILTPLRLDPKEDPHPPPHDLEEHEQEDAALDLVEALQARRELAQPSEPQDQVDDDGAVVQPVGVEGAVPAQPEGVFGIAARGGEEGQVPVLGDVPVEGVAGVDEGEEDPVRRSVELFL